MPRTNDGGWILDESDAIPASMLTEKDKEEMRKRYPKEAEERKKQLEEMFKDTQNESI